MFSKKMVMIVGVILLIAVNIIALSIPSHLSPVHRLSRIAIFIIAPFQNVVTGSIRFAKSLWNDYFFLISAAKENERLRKALSHAIDQNSRCYEFEISNIRLRKLLNFRKTLSDDSIAAEVIGKDPSFLFKTIIIDKGDADGVVKGLPVVVPEGIVGQIIDASSHYSKVLLIIDQNSAVDALLQRSRARGVIKGELYGQCVLKYVLRKHEVLVNDTVISSGFDGVFPKGLRVGYVSDIIRPNSGIFQEISVTPYVDFEKLEEVLVLLNPPRLDNVDSGDKEQ